MKEIKTKRYRLYKGDCLKILYKLKKHSIDFILCDLPYGTTQCSWDIIIPFDELWKAYNFVLKPNGVIALFGAEPFSSSLRLSNINNYKYDWIWEKSKATNYLNSKKQPLRASENISIFYSNRGIYNPQMNSGNPYSKGKALRQTKVYGSQKETLVKNDTGDRFPRNIIYFKTAESEGKVFHPTQKPISILEYFIKTYTNDNNIVLDNCMGSGSTGVACLNTNRRFIGIEKDVNIFEIACNRIKDHCPRINLLGK